MNSINDNYKIESRQDGIKDFGNGFLVSIAGPGTGKTYGLLMRVEKLAEDMKEESNIVYLTFIKEIVDKFSQDLNDYFKNKKKNIPKIEISTLHSFAWRILRNLGHHINLPKHVEVIGLNWKDRWSIILLNDIRNILVNRGTHLSMKKLKQSMNDYLKCRREMLDFKMISVETIQFLNTLKELSNKMQIIDWDNVVPLALSVLGKEDNIPSWIQRISHFLVDEYQDLNPSENIFFLKISHHAKSIVITGDHFQSVYSGRNATPKTLSELAGNEDKYSLNLVLCKKRPPEKIVEAANSLLKIMSGKDFNDVRLIPSEKDGVIRTIQFSSAKKEINFLATQIKIWENNNSHKDIVGLFPTWDLAESYKGFLKDVGVSCVTKGQSSIKKERMNLVLKLLKLKSHAFIERLILSDFFNLNKVFSKAIVDFVYNSKTIQEIVESYVSIKRCSEETKKEAEFYSTFINYLRAGNFDLALPYINKYVGEDMTKYTDIINAFIKDSSDSNLQYKCEECLSEIFNSHEESNIKEIQLLSMHSAKGLSKKYVFIPACEERFIPSNNVGHKKEEMLRLFYIAITRAEKEVLITYPKTRDSKRKVKGIQFGNGVLSEFARATGIKEEIF